MRRQTRLRLAALERDDNCCIDCGAYSQEVHHIVGRGHRGAWCIENLVTLCTACHREAHNRAARERHIDILRSRYGYVYQGELWEGVIMNQDI